MVAAAVTRGNVLVRDCLPEHLDAVIGKLRAAGVEVTVEGEAVRVVGTKRDSALPTSPPGPTPVSHGHAGPVMVLMAQAHGRRC